MNTVMSSRTNIDHATPCSYSYSTMATKFPKLHITIRVNLSYSGILKKLKKIKSQVNQLTTTNGILIIFLFTTKLDYKSRGLKAPSAAVWGLFPQHNGQEYERSVTRAKQLGSYGFSGAKWRQLSVAARACALHIQSCMRGNSHCVKCVTVTAKGKCDCHLDSWDPLHSWCLHSRPLT